MRLSVVLCLAVAALSCGSAGHTANPGAGGGGDGGGGGESGAGGAGGGAARDAAPVVPGPDASFDVRAADAPAVADLPPPSDLPVAPREAPVAGCAATPTPGTLVDAHTCLVWQMQKQPARTNVQAARTCADLVLGSFSDWRVPSPEELATWPGLMADSNAYITNPTYIPSAAAPMDGCTGNAHSCNLTEYNAGSISCAWQGVGFTGAFVCVRGTARPGTLATQYAAANCDACKVHVTGAAADFKIVDCLPYAP